MSVLLVEWGCRSTAVQITIPQSSPFKRFRRFGRAFRQAFLSAFMCNTLIGSLPGIPSFQIVQYLAAIRPLVRWGTERDYAQSGRLLLDVRRSTRHCAFLTSRRSCFSSAAAFSAGGTGVPSFFAILPIIAFLCLI